MLSLSNPTYGRLSENPTLYQIPKLSIPEKVEWIIELARRTQSPYYFRLTSKTLTSDPLGFQTFCRLRYKTEKGEIFRHPVRFIESGGDCDDQTIFYLANWIAEKSPGSVKIIIVRNKNFLHISQTWGGKVFDFLPYRWPDKNNTIIYSRSL